MNECNCSKCNINQTIFKKDDTWTYVKTLYWRIIYKCSVCGSYWEESVGGHGWTTYTKIEKIPDK